MKIKYIYINIYNIQQSKRIVNIILSYIYIYWIENYNYILYIYRERERERERVEEERWSKGGGEGRNISNSLELIF